MTGNHFWALILSILFLLQTSIALASPNCGEAQQQLDASKAKLQQLEGRYSSLTNRLEKTKENLEKAKEKASAKAAAKLERLNARRTKLQARHDRAEEACASGKKKACKKQKRMAKKLERLDHKIAQNGKTKKVERLEVKIEKTEGEIDSIGADMVLADHDRELNVGELQKCSVCPDLTIPANTDSIWQNPRNPFDVTNDRHISSSDILTIVNELNASGPRELPQTGVTPSEFFDVNGDGSITEADVQSLQDILNASTSCWQNPINRFDVDNDGEVSPSDVLAVVNEISANGSHALPGESAFPPPYFDVNGDLHVTSMDSDAIADYLNSPHAGWQNPDEPLDVNGDTHVSPIDVLLIINEVNANGEHALPKTGVSPPPFYDVDGDGQVEYQDAQIVVDHLNGK